LARVALTFEDIVAGAPPLGLLLLAEQGEGDALAAGAAARKPRNKPSTVARLGAVEEESRAEVAFLGG
jgi:hypothetical protein